MRRCTVGSLAVMLVIVLSACGEPTSATPSMATAPTTVPSTTVNPGPVGRLRVTQNQTECCYAEGQVSVLIVRDGGGSEVAHREFQTIDPVTPVVDLQLPAGPYEIESSQRPCDANCGFLDPATDQCSLRVDLAAATDFFLTVAFAPSKGCTITRTDQPLQSPVPDEFALREPYKDCGFDSSLEVPGGAGGLERSCFAAANAARQAAELSAFEAGSNPEAPDFLVYRTNADGTVDVFLPNLGRQSDAPWRSYSCAGLAADSVRGFALQQCTEPVEIDVALSATTQP